MRPPLVSQSDDVSPATEENLFHHRAFDRTLFSNERERPSIDHFCPFLHLGAPGPGPTNYSSVLTNTSATYRRAGSGTNYLHYYEALKITVYTAGNYTIRSSSRLDTFGYLYNNTFDPTYPSRNMLQYDDQSAWAYQFLLSMYLQTLTNYIVVATTYDALATGSFSILVQGPATVNISLADAPG